MKFSSRKAGTLTALAILLGASPAFAQNSAYYQMIVDGYDDDPKDPNGGQNDGAGNEHPHAVVIEDGEDVYVVSIFMNTNTDGNENYACECASTKFSPGAAPELVAHQRLTDYQSGDRQCNAPGGDAITVGGKHLIPWAFGSDYNNNNPRTYLRVLDHMCNQVVEENLLISANANNNEGAPSVIHVRTEGNVVDLGVAYGSTNNNDSTKYRAVKMTVEGDEIILDKGELNTIIAPANIPRPAQAKNPDSTYLLHCQARGNNRPPEMGVQCAYIDGLTGEIMWKEYIRQSDPENDSYANQATVAYLGDNKYAVLLLESSGLGKKTNIKGATETELHVIRATEDGMTKLSKIRNIGAYEAHSSVCAGPYGDEGKLGIGVIDASITGIGPTVLEVATYDAMSNQLTFNDDMHSWIINPYDGDSGYAQNIYGGNPHTQGRGHPYCLGTMRNPSFGMEVGFMPQVETFFVVPHVAGRNAEEKLAMYVGVVPGKVTKATAPGAPTDDGTPIENPTPQGENPGPGPGGEVPGVPGGPGGPTLGDAGTAGGCAVASGSNNDWNAFGFLALGLGFIGLAARRREV